MAWWIWVVLGFALVFAELVTTTFFFIFFAGGALLVGLLVGLSVIGPDWVQWLLFSVLSLACVGLFRRKLVARFNVRKDSEATDLDDLAGSEAVATADIVPGASGPVQMRGTAWNARNLAGEPVMAGQRCKVERVNGLVLEVRPVSMSPSNTPLPTAEDARLQNTPVSPSNREEE